MKGEDVESVEMEYLVGIGELAYGLNLVRKVEPCFK